MAVPGARTHVLVSRDAPLAEFVRIAAQYPVSQVTALEGARQ